MSAVFNKLQLNPIQPLTFLPQEAFPFVLTLMKVLLLIEKQNLLVGKVHQEACCVVLLKIVLKP